MRTAVIKKRHSGKILPSHGNQRCCRASLRDPFSLLAHIVVIAFHQKVVEETFFEKMALENMSFKNTKISNISSTGAAWGSLGLGLPGTPWGFLGLPGAPWGFLGLSGVPGASWLSGAPNKQERPKATRA